MDFSIMEIKPKPLGVMQTAKSSGSLDTSSLVVTGILGGLSDLTVGATYYTTTSGKLVTPGTTGTPSNPALTGYLYYTDKVTQTIVSADSEIGVAVSSTSILLRMK